MAFKDTILTFEDDKIVTDDGGEVMMSWEAPIMEKSAEYVCQSKGDILEIGFGMGICSDYIQAQDVNSHTIVEIHPQIIEKLNIWANGKSNVTVVEGDWNRVSGFGTYDGIFLDTFGADSVLFLTITEWDTNYVVIAANVTVGLEYVLLSTRTNEVLWSYSEKIVIDTGSSSGNILVDVIATAVSTAMTDYVPIASSVHQEAVKALPFGVYHPKSGNDGIEKTVVSSSKEVALQ